LPVLGIAFGIARAELHGASAKRYRFDITGYDPRDLLQGHYLQYRLALGEAGAASPCNDDDPACALCLQSIGSGVPPALRRVSLSSEAPSCSSILRTEFLERLSRFYIPEARAAELTEKLRVSAQNGRAQLIVAVDSSGVPSAEALWLDGEEVRP